MSRPTKRHCSKCELPDKDWWTCATKDCGKTFCRHIYGYAVKGIGKGCWECKVNELDSIALKRGAA